MGNNDDVVFAGFGNIRCDQVLSEDKIPMYIFTELWSFLRVRKKLWLLPMILMTVLFGLLLVLAESSAIAPFIYTLF